MVVPTPTSLASILLLSSPFQWFTVAGAKTFRIPKLRDSGAGLGGTAFLLGTLVVLWRGLFIGFDLIPAACGAALSVLSVVLYEWARRTIVGRRFAIALAEEVPEALCEDGPYRYIRHPFYFSYVLASLGMLVATLNLMAAAVFVFNSILFTYMARDDERTLKASPLASAYDAYRQRVGFLMLLPGRRS
jgi:protein-S-isoprenylcysteine O-methyltransferase Ste14